MGKDLNGKELGTGIMQRKDGRYDIVNITLHFFHKDVRPMLPHVTKHSIAVVSPMGVPLPISETDSSVIPIADEIPPDESF
jgi:hypothetical protein